MNLANVLFVIVLLQFYQNQEIMGLQAGHHTQNDTQHTTTNILLYYRPANRLRAVWSEARGDVVQRLILSFGNHLFGY